MLTKYFVISDIHGHYDEMMKALTYHNYNQENSSHHLIVLGDLFDRGSQSKEVLEYLYKLRLENKVSLVLGNHDNFLIDFLNGNYSKLIFNMKRNGFKSTLESLIGRELSLNENWDEINYEIKIKYIYLYNFLSSLPYYLEIGDYIFVHGGIKSNNGNWKNNNKDEYIWGREKNNKKISGKIVVAGHHRVSTIRYPKIDQKELFLRNPEAFSILREDGKIYVDSYVEISKRINVLVLDL